MVPVREVPRGVLVRRCDHRDRRNAGRRLCRDRRQRTWNRGGGCRSRPHRGRLHRRLVSRALPAGAGAARHRRRRHDVRHAGMSGPRALVLTAGLGTRLQPLTYVRAKAAVPVNGDTLARRAVRWLVSHGVTDLVLNLHHRPETITRSVGDGSDMGATVRYSWEEPLLGSAGGPRHALPLLLDEAPVRTA